MRNHVFFPTHPKGCCNSFYVFNMGLRHVRNHFYISNDQMSMLTGDMNINVKHGHLDRYKIYTLLRGHTDETTPTQKITSQCKLLHGIINS